MSFGVNLFIEFVHDVNRSLECTTHTETYKCYIHEKHDLQFALCKYVDYYIIFKHFTN